MSPLSRLIAFSEGTVFFAAESVLLLVSIAIAFRTRNTKLFFASSGICLFASIATMVFELSRSWTARMINAETMSTTMLSGMLSATFAASLGRSMTALIVRTHVLIAAALCMCLGIGLCMVRMDLQRDVDLQVCLPTLCSCLTT